MWRSADVGSVATKQNNSISEKPFRCATQVPKLNPALSEDSAQVNADHHRTGSATSSAHGQSVHTA